MLIEDLKALDKAEFVTLLGGVYEHSPWLAEAVFDSGLENVDSLEDLVSCFEQALSELSKEQKLDLIRAHPDLAGKAAVEGKLTESSTEEQKSAGIDQCTMEEFVRFQTLNDAYKKKFGFPFIKAVKGSNRHVILEAFSERIHNDIGVEFKQALHEINKIARFRLASIVTG